MSENDDAEQVDLTVAGRGVVVEGTPSAVARLADRIRSAAGDGRIRSLLAEGLAVAESIASPGDSYREYFEFSPRALEAMRENNLVPSTDGWFYGFVRDAEHIAANLEWRPVEVATERALATKTAATTLALQAAIRDVQHALDMIEGKVDHILELVRAERLGNVAGDRRTLMPLVAEVRQRGTISATDWSTVDFLGATIARDIEALRAYIQRQIDQAGQRRLGRTRSDALDGLTDDLVSESLALLVLAEDNLLMWHELKLAREVTDRHVLDDDLADTNARISELTDADQRLVLQLAEVADALMAPTGWEGFRWLERRSLADAGEAATGSIDWFAAQRNLDVALEAADYPTTTESLKKAADLATDAGRRAISEIRDRLDRRTGDD